MIKYIKIELGNLYAYRNGLTISTGEKLNWVPSKLDYSAILLSDRTDYTELEEFEVREKYGKEVTDSARALLNKLDKTFKKRQ